MDLSSISDADLMQQIGSDAAPAPADALKSLSDAQLLAAITPATPAAPEPIGENRSSLQAALRGIPLAGTYVDKATAALNAAVQPLADTGLSKAETFSERTAENEKRIKGAVDAYEKENPIGTTVGKIALGGAAMAPLIAAAPAAFGVGGAGIGASMLAGGATGAAIGAADAGLRGENVGEGAKYGLIGGAAGPAAGRVIGSAVKGIQQSPAVTELAKAAERQGVSLPTAAASESLPIQRTAAALKEIPIIGDPLVKSSRRASEQMGDALTRVEQGFGSGSTLNAGDVAKTGLVDWITGKSKDVMSRLYGSVDTLVNPATTRELDATRTMVANIAAQRHAAGLPGNGKATELVFDAVQRPGGLNYKGTKTLRTALGEMLDSGVLPADISKGELKRIYGALTTDLRDTVSAAGGQDALKAFNRANNINVLVSQRREALAKIVGIEGDAAPEKVIDRLIAMASGNARADQQKLILARKTIGAPNWNEVASSAVSRIGRDAEGNFSPDRFITAYGKLSPNGKLLLFGSTGKSDLASALDDIALLSSRAKQLASFGNPSGTGRVVGGGMALGGLIHSPEFAIPGAFGGYAAARVMARPLRQSTLRVAVQNPNVRALVDQLSSAGLLSAGIAGRSTTPVQIPAPPPPPPLPMMRGM